MSDIIRILAGRFIMCAQDTPPGLSTCRNVPAFDNRGFSYKVTRPSRHVDDATLRRGNFFGCRHTQD